MDGDGDGITMAKHVSHEKNHLTFHYTGWFIGIIGILIMVYYNPYITG